ncbi:MAG: hypothetical protein WC718_14470 [Phycisphaerales bacterium]|jgi:hypothetical protein
MTALHRIIFRKGINILTGLWLDSTQVTASAAELNALDITAAGTAEASKAVVADANIDVAGLRNVTATGTVTAGAVAANDAALDITGKAAVAAGNGGAVALVAGRAHTNGVGGAISATAGAGSATGTGAGGEASMVAGASGGGATGNGGEAKLTGGAAASTNGNGGAATIAAGAATGTGTGGAASVTGGASAGGTGTAGGVVIDAGAAAGGTGAAVSIAPTNATGVTIGQTVTLAADKNLLLQGTGKLSLAGTTVDATADEINKAADATALAADGLLRMGVARATYDFASDAGELGAIGSGVTLPDNAIVIGGFVDVVTTCQSEGADAGTMAISVQGANDIVAAVAISAATDWDAGLHAIVPKSNAPETTGIKLTAAREITFTIGTQKFTAGKFTVFLHYVVGD